MSGISGSGGIQLTFPKSSLYSLCNQWGDKAIQRSYPFNQILNVIYNEIHTQWLLLQWQPRAEISGIDIYIIGVFSIVAYLCWKFRDMNGNILIYNQFPFNNPRMI